MRPQREPIHGGSFDVEDEEVMMGFWDVDAGF